MLRVLDLCYKVAIFQLELEACTSRVRLVLKSELELETCTSCTRLALQSCDFPETCTSRAILVLQSCDFQLRALDLHYKVAIFQRARDF